MALIVLKAHYQRSRGVVLVVLKAHYQRSRGVVLVVLKAHYQRSRECGPDRTSYVLCALTVLLVLNSIEGFVWSLTGSVCMVLMGLYLK